MFHFLRSVCTGQIAVWTPEDGQVHGFSQSRAESLEPYRRYGQYGDVLNICGVYIGDAGLTAAAYERMERGGF